MSSKIFISYRRDDSAYAAGRLADNLLAHFDKDQIFMDIDYIEPGDDFAQAIIDAVSSCRILIAVIGKGWLSSSKDGSTRRLDNPNDFVRLEIATALRRNVYVIPVLVQGASLPTSQDLPDDLRQLSRRQAVKLDNKHWKPDVEVLISSLKGRLDKELKEERRQLKDKAITTAESDAVSWDRRMMLIVRITLIAVVIVGVVMFMVVRAGDSTQPEITQNKIGMELVYVQAGGFVMGSHEYKPGVAKVGSYLSEPNERPEVYMKIGQGFYIGVYEVTQEQWQRVMEKNPSFFQGSTLPVERVSWDEAQKFINKLNEIDTEYTYRLPTEAEWEYACRAGTQDNYAGDLDAMAWYSENSDGTTHPVGSRLVRNNFGLYDMHGNVWEWCADWYRENYDAPPDNKGDHKGDQIYRVARGGSWLSTAFACRSASRRGFKPDSRNIDLGFRIVAVVRS